MSNQKYAMKARHRLLEAPEIQVWALLPGVSNQDFNENRKYFSFPCSIIQTHGIIPNFQKLFERTRAPEATRNQAMKPPALATPTAAGDCSSQKPSSKPVCQDFTTGERSPSQEHALHLLGSSPSAAELTMTIQRWDCQDFTPQ